MNTMKCELWIQIRISRNYRSLISVHAQPTIVHSTMCILFMSLWSKFNVFTSNSHSLSTISFYISLVVGL